MVVLDTDHMSLLEWSGAQGSATLRTRLATLQPAEVVTTIISYEEQVRGWMAYIARIRSITQQVDAYRRLHRQLGNYCRIPVLAFDAPVMRWKPATPPQVQIRLTPVLMGGLL